MKNQLRITFLILLISSVSYAQKLPFKVGKVSEEELLMKECSFYPEATSMRLGEYGEIKFLYNDSQGWKYRMDVSVRIKIFKITDADQANVKIRLYEPVKGSAKEEVNTIKAYVYNLVDGKIEKEKLDNSEYFEKRINDYWIEKSFAIPNVKEGSVFEYTYTKLSDYLYNLTDWQFQHDIPTAYSEIRFVLPQFFNYQVSQLGNYYLAEKEEKTIPEQFRFSYKVESNKVGFGSGAQRATTHTGTRESQSRYGRFVIRNILPVEDEPFMNNKLDAPSRLEFQLVYTDFGNGINTIAGDYTKFNKELMQDDNFGYRLNRGNFIKSFAETIAPKNDLEKAQLVYNHLTNHFTWNKTNSFTSKDAGRTAYNNKEGSIADINLSLIAAFKEVGLTAYPIILSTRGSGVVHPVYPSYEDFNYVIAAVQLGDQVYFCDASSKMPFGILPLKCRNGNGWLAGEHGGQWVNLKNGSQFDKLSMLTMEIKGDQIVTKVNHKESGYAGIRTMKEILSSSEDEYVADISNNFTEAELANFQHAEVQLAKPFTYSYELIKEGGAADVMYIQPITLGTFLENPFKRESRISPIDFPYSQSYKVITQISVPEGYTAELPEPIRIALPDKAGSYLFNVSQIGNKINVVSDLSINKTDFGINEYQTLKNFFQMVSDKNQELIVLSK